MTNVDLILFNANVHTVNEKKPLAQAIAIKKAKISAVGSDKEILKLKTRRTTIIDLKRKTVLPGLVDCHVHLGSYAKTLQQVGLRDVLSIRQLQRKLKEAAEQKPASSWIVARGFDQEKFEEKRMPNRFDLDRAVPDHPVLITRVCGHLSVANTRALELAGIGKISKTLEDAKIEKDPKTGEPTGVLLENAIALVKEAIPKSEDKELLKIYGEACQKATEKGLTEIHCIIENLTEIHVIQELRKQGKLRIRINIMIPFEFFDDLKTSIVDSCQDKDRIKIRCIKIFADGSLGARTAALNAPYADDKTTKGILISSQEKLETLFEKVHGSGLQLAIHAIGDRAIETALAALDNVLKKKPRKDHRHRIEHASILSPKLIHGMRKLGVIASVQPHFVSSDFWITQRLGKRRARWAYPFKSLIRGNVNICAGSDCPIEPIDPLLGVWAAVAPKSPLQERLSVDEAIRMYTINAAFAGREEAIKGSIEPGKVADLTVLSQDPYNIEPSNIKNISVEMTIVDGEIVFGRKS
ncbi:MAG TPA: amidohydrolase [Candidatus Bathyarchaeia archaeon]|nr:amidohydrolase [Candidatus Bathyarchaeia archaeon]